MEAVGIDLVDVFERQVGKPLDFGIGEDEGRKALGLVGDDGLGNVVGKGAVPLAVVLRPKARHKADAAQVQLAVFKAKILLDHAVEGLLPKLRVGAVQRAQARALEHGVGHHAAAAGLKVVAVLAALVHHLVVHAGFRIGVDAQALHEIGKDAHKLVPLRALGKDVDQIRQGHAEPADGAQPEILGKAGMGI